MTIENQDKVRLIKKYKNRRLYDVSRSQYITIEELQGYVFHDIDFRVLDVSTDKDLTNATLLQIFVDLEANSANVLSPKILRQLIKLSQHPMSHQYKGLLEKMFLSFQEQVDPVTEGIQKTTEFLTKQSEDLVKSWQDLFRQRGD